MEISGSYSFNAQPERVWAVLMDPAALSSCIPGCRGFEPDGEDRYKVALTVGLAAITGSYDGTVVVADKKEPFLYRLVVEGEGRPGFVKGSSTIVLRANGAATDVDVTGTVQIGGHIARVGQRLVGGVAKMMLDSILHLLAGEDNPSNIDRGSAPDPGSVACGGPMPRAAPSRARRARRRYAATRTEFSSRAA